MRSKCYTLGLRGSNLRFETVGLGWVPCSGPVISFGGGTTGALGDIHCCTAAASRPSDLGLTGRRPRHINEKPRMDLLERLDEELAPGIPRARLRGEHQIAV